MFLLNAIWVHLLETPWCSDLLLAGVKKTVYLENAFISLNRSTQVQFYLVLGIMWLGFLSNKGTWRGKLFAWTLEHAEEDTRSSQRFRAHGVTELPDASL